MITEAARVLALCLLFLLHALTRWSADSSALVADRPAGDPDVVTDRETTLTAQAFASVRASRAPPALRA